MPHRQLIDGRLKMSFHDSGFEKGRGHVLIIELAAILAPWPAPGIGAVIRQIQRAVVAQFADQL